MIRVVSIWLACCLLSALKTAAFAQDATGNATIDNVARRVVIRFLTTEDFPPFNALDEESVLTGLNVDLAQSICQDLSINCDIKVLPWDALLPALQSGTADAVIAAHRVTAKLARDFSFSKRYFYTPARFAVRSDATSFAITPTGLDGRRVAVVRGSAHAAYLMAFFRDTEVVQVDTPELAREALQSRSVDAVFDDGISLVFWVNGSSSRACCVLRGGPYFEPRYFGDGIAIVVTKDDQELLRLLNQSINRLQANGRFREIVEKFFPIRVY